MKKGFGWFFIVLGILNIVRGVAMLSDAEWAAHGGRLIVFAIGLIILGITMINYSNNSKSKWERGK